MFKICSIALLVYLYPLFSETTQISACYKTFDSNNTNLGLLYSKALVIGSGSFGTGISSVLAQNFERVFITTRKAQIFNSINKLHINERHLSERLSNNVEAVFFNSKYQDQNLKNTNWDLVVFALPLSSLESVLKRNKNFFSALARNNTPFVSLSKGIETRNLKFSDDIFLEILPELKDNLAFLSGPSFAQEIAKKEVTFVTLSGKNKANLLKIHHMLSTPEFKARLTTDVKGVLIGRAVKNAIAIAVGIAEGLDVGANTKAGLMTLLFDEAVQLGYHYKASLKTLHGLSGLGDIILSSEGKTSRNKSFGLAIGQKGHRPQDFIKEKGDTIEGYHTVFSLNQIIERKKLDLPLFQTLFHILYENASPNLLIQKLKEQDPIFDISYDLVY